MPWEISLGLILGALVVLFVIGLPIFVAFMAINIVGILVLFGFRGFGFFTNSLFETTTSSALIAVPLFLFMGELLFRSGAIKVVYTSLDQLVGRSVRRLYYLSISLATIFGALSGSSMGVAAMMGRSVLPGMVDRGYDRRLSIATILGGASLAPIIPPSVIIILIGSLSGASIADLLIGGIVPGLLIALLMLLFVIVSVALRPDRAPAVPDDAPDVPAARKVLAIGRMVPFVIIILSILGSIFAGIATPEESAATGVLGTVIVAALYRTLSPRVLAEAAMNATLVAAMIMAVMMSSKLFSQLLAFTGATGGLVSGATSLPVGPEVMLFILLAIPFVLCLFIDPLGLMLVVVPVYVPLIAALGFDETWFWVLFLINITIGSISPPFGLTLFALNGAYPAASLREIYAAAWPMVAIFLTGLMLVVLIPGLATFLPGLLR